MTYAHLYRHRWLLIRLPIVLAVVVMAAAAWRWLYPMPPTQLTISSGQADGAYQRHAMRYAEAFSRHGISLEIHSSEGSATNLQRLQAQPPQTDLALVQGGFGWSSAAGAARSAADVQTLGSVDIEVLWLFSREQPMTSLLDLVGKRVAAGPDGSGHRAMLQRLLKQMQVDLGQVAMTAHSGVAARDALLRHEVDAVFMVAAPSAPGIGALLSARGVHLASLRRTAAISERNNYLENRLLPEDTLGPGQPPADTPVLTTPTHLLVRQDLDPALKRLAAAVAMEVHGGADAFHRAGEFPALRFSDFPSAPEARRVLSQGLGGLEALLPFWWAQVLQRLLVIGVPMLLLALVLARLVPAWVRWRLENRVTRWYGELRFIENDLANNAVNLGGMDLSRIHGRLNGMETAIVGEGLPPELAQRCYTLRQHVNFVRHRIREYRGR